VTAGKPVHLADNWYAEAATLPFASFPVCLVSTPLIFLNVCLSAVT
jgi:hypothetical protein